MAGRFVESQTDVAIFPQTSEEWISARSIVRSKSDGIGIRIRSVCLIRIDTYRAFGAENMIASPPLSRWVSIGEDGDGINATLGDPRGFSTFAAPTSHASRFLSQFYAPALLRLARLLRRLALRPATRPRLLCFAAVQGPGPS